MIFFTSDTHLRHRNILRYCNRPFETIEEHDETLITNWNSVVSAEDKVYHLGDFSFCHPRTADWLLSRLNGDKYILHGNHDKKRNFPRNTELFTDLGHYHELTIQDRELKYGKILIVLCHYAFEVWNKSHHGSIHLFGHSHGKLPSRDNQLRLDVGVDVHNYTPISYEQVKAIMVKRRPELVRG